MPSTVVPPIVQSGMEIRPPKPKLKPRPPPPKPRDPSGMIIGEASDQQQNGVAIVGGGSK